jgi:gas vesicle protein
MNKLIMAVLGGAAVGFIVGTLTAPEKGQELRKKIVDSAGSWAEKLVDIFASGSKNLNAPRSGDVSVSADEILG